MALFVNDQQQHEEEQPNQLQQYGVCVGNRRIRTVQRVPYVPAMNIGRPILRAKQLPAYPVREQQHVMLQDRINQDVQHNIQQDNIAYNRRPYADPQVHTYITSVMEVIHRLSKQLKWDSSKPKVQAITSGEESTTNSQKKEKTKGKGKGKANLRVHLFPIKERERVEKAKERINQKENGIMPVGRTGIKELPLFPLQLHQLRVQRL